MTGMLRRGKLKWFDHNRGYGFLVPDDGTEDVMLHIKNCRNLEMGLVQGASFRFETYEDYSGLRARNVILADDAPCPCCGQKMERAA